jgi:hypothetical protein
MLVSAVFSAFLLSRIHREILQLKSLFLPQHQEPRATKPTSMVDKDNAKSAETATHVKATSQRPKTKDNPRRKLEMRLLKSRGNTGESRKKGSGSDNRGSNGRNVSTSSTLGGTSGLKTTLSANEQAGFVNLNSEKVDEKMIRPRRCGVLPSVSSESSAGYVSSGTDSSSDHKKSKFNGHRVAIIFFGLSRSLRWTQQAIQRHIFDVLDRNGIVYDVFWSTMVTPELNNPRSKEAAMHLDEYDVRLMNPCRFSLIDQGKIRQNEFSRFCAARRKVFFDPRNEHENKRYKLLESAEAVRKWNATASGIAKSKVINAACPIRDTFRDDFRSMKNMLCSYYTQKDAADTVKAYAEEHALRYTAWLAMRPDTSPVVDLDLPSNLERLGRVAGQSRPSTQLTRKLKTMGAGAAAAAATDTASSLSGPSSSSSATTTATATATSSSSPSRRSGRLIYIANFHHWDGLNDRFAYGTPEAMELYLHRYAQI